MLLVWTRLYDRTIKAKWQWIICHLLSLILQSFYRKKKNDQFLKGSWVFIARSDVAPCPWNLSEKLLKMGSHTESPGSRAQRETMHTRKHLCSASGQVSWSKERGWIKALIVFIAFAQGMHPLDLCLRSQINCSRDKGHGEALRQTKTKSRSHKTLHFTGKTHGTSCC